MQKYILRDLDFALELFSNCTYLDRMGIAIINRNDIFPKFNIPIRLTAREISYANVVCQKNYRNEEMIVIR